MFPILRLTANPTLKNFRNLKKRYRLGNLETQLNE